MKQTKGFSLIELLVVIAIIGILAGIAYPMYQKYLIRAACDNGKAGLLQADAMMNQLYMKYGVYNNEAIQGGVIPGMASIPIDGSGGPADFTLMVDPTATTYSITATVTGTGRLGAYAGGTLTINEKGDRGGVINGENVWTAGCSAL